MRRVICRIGLTALIALERGHPAVAAEPTRRPIVWVIPLQGVIERALVYVVRRGVQRAVEERAELIVFEMDTPGGRLDAAEEILRILGGLPLPTCTWVNPRALSAGAIIAMGTDEIYMSPASVIGDALPILVSLFGGPEPMPESMEEKAVTAVSALMRTNAQRKGHDAQLAAAMVRREMEYKIGDEVIKPKGQLLTLTNVEAERLVERDGRSEPLLSRGTVSHIEELCRRRGLESVQIVRVHVSAAERVARWIELLSPLLLVGGLLGLYIEFKTPGFGLPGTVGIFLVALWFWGHHIAGLAGMGEILLFLLGLVLLIVELLLIPGFGVVGITGLVLMAAGLFLATVPHYPGVPWYRPDPNDLARSVVMMSASLAAAFAGMAILARYLPRTSVFQKLALSAAVGSAEGYRAAPSHPNWVGRRGVAATVLRPAGIGEFDGQRVNVITRGQFVEAGRPIVIVEAKGHRMLVEEVRPETEPSGSAGDPHG